MLAYNGSTSGLFHGAFLQSGSPIPVGTLTEGQVYYNQLVNATSCSLQSDTLACLRRVDLGILSRAINDSPGIFAYQSLVLAWTPRADGSFLSDNPQRLVQQNRVANIPFVSGDVDDEGTIFSQSTLNITSDSEFENYIKTIWLPNATDAQLEPLFSQYPSDRSAGSPYNTSIESSITSQYKRMASFQGDAVFQAPRRFFMQTRAVRQSNIWGFREANHAFELSTSG